MTGELILVADIKPGDSFTFNGVRLDVFMVECSERTGGRVLITTDDDREFVASPKAIRRVVRS